jgi:hypothetical protein
MGQVKGNTASGGYLPSKSTYQPGKPTMANQKPDEPLAAAIDAHGRMGELLERARDGEEITDSDMKDATDAMLEAGQRLHDFHAQKRSQVAAFPRSESQGLGLAEEAAKRVEADWQKSHRAAQVDPGRL